MSDDMFKPGTHVVYPHHGVAIVDKIEKRDFNDEKVDFLVLRVVRETLGTHGSMTVSVPASKAAEVGIRLPISGDEIEDVLEVLGQTDVRVPSNWSRRFKNHQEKMKSGDPYEIAEVVRNLTVRGRKTQMSAAERTMYEKARYILVSELAVSWNVSEEDAGKRIDEVLDNAAAA